MSLSELVNLCHSVGSRAPVWNQGVGGNVSLKQQSDRKLTLFIKSSGCRLDEVSQDRGISLLDLAAFRGKIGQLETLSMGTETGYSEVLGGCVRGAGRPSMETGIHAILPATWIVHFHSLAAVLMWHENKRHASRFGSWVRRHCPWPLTFIEAVRPGWELTLRLSQTPDFVVYVLRCHGVVLQLDDTRQIDDWLEFEQRFCLDWRYDRLGALLKSAEPLEAARVARWSPAPMRLFFPDSAVFYERMTCVLQPEGNPDPETRYSLARDAWDTDPDVSEIWLATQILYESCSTLEELDGEFAGSISRLPTERYRQRLGRQAEGDRT